jgi:hypothetical protein
MLGYQVTLTSNATTYNLLTLVLALNSNFIDRGEIFVQAEPDGGAQLFFVGGSDCDSTHYGWKLSAGDATPSFNHLAGVYVRCDTNSKKLNIFVGSGK